MELISNWVMLLLLFLRYSSRSKQGGRDEYLQSNNMIM